MDVQSIPISAAIHSWQRLPFENVLYQGQKGFKYLLVNIYFFNFIFSPGFYFN